MDKSLLFLILALICLWLVLDNYYGKALVNSAISKILGD